MTRESGLAVAREKAGYLKAMLQRLTIQRLTVAILFIMLFAMAARTPVDSDTWWHIRSGSYMVHERTILTSDPFSHTRNGAEWIDHGWGAQLVIYGLYELFGGSTAPGDPGNIGLGLYTAALATLGMWFIYLMCDGTVYVRAWAVILGVATAAVFWSPRPQMFSFVLGAVVLYLLHLYKRQKTDWLWLIPPLIVVWANLHGGFAIGFIFLIGSIAGEMLGNLFNADDARVVPWARLKKMVLVTIVSVPMVALNPHGVAMLSYPFRTVGIGALQDFVQEWTSPDFHDPVAWPFAILLLGVLAFAGLSSKRLDWTDLVLVSGTAMMGLMARRNIAVFAIAATPIFARHFNQWLTDRGWQIRPMTRVRGARMWLNWTILLVIIIAAVFKVVYALNRETVRKAQESLLPVELATYLNESPPPGLMFNSYNWGGYLMFAAPNVPVFIDGRTDLYDDAFVREYMDITRLRKGWKEKLAAQDIGFVAIENESLLAAMLREQPEQWREQVFDDGVSSLFVRVVSEEATNE